MNKTALSRALEMLENHMNYFHDEFKEELEWPSISLGPENDSVAVYWKEPEYELLVNVPAEGDASYYGSSIFNRQEMNLLIQQLEKISPSLCASLGVSFEIRGSFNPKEINKKFLKLWIDL
jgi:hypothetical protein